MIEIILCFVLFIFSAFLNIPTLLLFENNKYKKYITLIVLFWFILSFVIYQLSKSCGIAWFSGYAIFLISMPIFALYEKISHTLPTFADIIISVVQGFIVIAGSSVLWCLLSFLEDLQWFIKLTIIVSHTIYLETPLQLIDVLTFIPVMVWNYKYNLKTAPYGIFEKFYYCSIQYIWVIVARVLWFDEFSILVTLSPIVPFILCIRNLVKECCKQKNKKGYT